MFHFQTPWFCFGLAKHGHCILVGIQISGCLCTGEMEAGCFIFRLIDSVLVWQDSKLPVISQWLKGCCFLESCFLYAFQRYVLGGFRSSWSGGSWWLIFFGVPYLEIQVLDSESYFSQQWLFVVTVFCHSTAEVPPRRCATLYIICGYWFAFKDGFSFCFVFFFFKFWLHLTEYVYCEVFIFLLSLLAWAHVEFPFITPAWYPLIWFASHRHKQLNSLNFLVV